MALARKSHQSETEREFCEILQMADPIVSRFVSEHEALKRSNEALLLRVTMLEHTLEQVARWDHDNHPEDAWRYVADAQEVLDG